MLKAKNKKEKRAFDDWLCLPFLPVCVLFICLVMIGLAGLVGLSLLAWGETEPRFAWRASTNVEVAGYRLHVWTPTNYFVVAITNRAWTNVSLVRRYLPEGEHHALLVAYDTNGVTSLPTAMLIWTNGPPQMAIQGSDDLVRWETAAIVPITLTNRQKFYRLLLQ